MRSYLRDSDHDKAVRARGEWPYFVLYAAVFVVAFLAGVPAPIELSLASHHERVADASAWAFLCSYPLFHYGMRARVYRSFGTFKGQAIVLALGTLILCVCWIPMQYTLPESPTGRGARALVGSPVYASLFLLFWSYTASFGQFLAVEPLRMRLVRWL